MLDGVPTPMLFIFGSIALIGAGSDLRLIGAFLPLVVMACWMWRVRMRRSLRGLLVTDAPPPVPIGRRDAAPRLTSREPA